MSKQLVGKEVTIVYLDEEGQEQESSALKVLEIDAGVITVRDPDGKIRAMNMTSPAFVQVYE